MRFSQSNAEVFAPRGFAVEEALAQTTHLAIGAHQDDLEIMAVDGILACYQRPDAWFSGVIVTDGAGSPRTGLYADTTDEEMQAVRVLEQKRAAFLGDYSAQVFLAHPSQAVKQSGEQSVINDLIKVIIAASPRIVYTHNLADKHPTHVGVAVKVVQALRQLSPAQRPEKVYGCEVWRDLGWMLDEDKVVFDTSAQPGLQQALLGVFDSQVSGGKRYDLATMGRRVANATFFESHATDETTGLAFGIDLTPLILDPQLDIQTYIRGYIDRFADDVARLISSVS